MTTTANNTSGKFKWELIILLWLVFFFNQADRQVFNIVLPLIKADLRLSDSQLGLIASVFIAAVGVFVPIAGYAGDVFRKKKVIIFSLFLWSAATFFTGISTGLLTLVILRSMVGSSESFYAPAANALIGDTYREERGFAMSIHQTALYAGIIMSGVLGAIIGEHYGWRATFYLFGGIGILLAILLIVRFRHFSEHTDIPLSPLSWLAGIRGLFAKPTAILLTLAFGCMVFVNVGYLTWTPTFLHEKFNQSLSAAGFSSMFYHHVFAFAGVLAGGKISDHLAKKDPSARLKIQFWGLLLGAPFIYMLGTAGNLLLVFLSLGCFGFFRGIYDSNIYASLYAVIDPRIRASVSATMIMFAFIIGAFAPYLLGSLKPTLGLSKGIAFLSVAYILGAIFIGLALKFTLAKDQVRELTSLPENYN
ncbi:MAG: MFS transporter [Mucilaginibacter sp.]|uniref:MFS transporter n=1 Tax=Mucilaginibacter sp. TaxID=1882438 RepID=UPI0032667460